MAVEKGRLSRDLARLRVLSAESFFASEFYLDCRYQHWPWDLAEEADQPLDVLRSPRQEELLANELHSAQAQARESDLILEFCEECLYLSPFPLGVRESWRVS